MTNEFTSDKFDWRLEFNFITSTIPDQLENLKLGAVRLVGDTRVWLVVFVLAFVSVNAFIYHTYGNNSSLISSLHRNIGGPSAADFYEGNDFAAGVATVSGALYENGNSPFVSAFINNEGAVYGTTHSFSSVIPEKNGVFKYKIKEGDNLSTIAYKFGITVNTILWANPETKTLISPGQEITILPVPGILYETKEKDTLESVATKHHIDSKLVEQYNSDLLALFDSPGSTIILPHARPLSGPAPVARVSLPAVSGYFGFPVDPENSWNWGRLHAYNAVDIAAHCGDAIYAAAEGIVREESGNNLWNGGYGNYVLIEHPNGTKTKYTHNLKNLVSVGEYILQGEKIALIGNTGNVHGPTGCHVHFEVRGAQNPFAVR